MISGNYGEVDPEEGVTCPSCGAWLPGDEPPCDACGWDTDEADPDRRHDDVEPLGGEP